jgi:hypothetical protein
MMELKSNTLFRHAILVRDWLAGRYLPIQGVKLIDIGYITNPGVPGRQVVIRIHVEDKATLKGLNVPETVMGIPVQVMASDLKL